METAALLSTLRARDVKLWVEDDRLKCSAPPGALDADLRARLAARKDDIVAFLKRAEALDRLPASLVPLQPDGNRRPVFVVSGHGGDVYSMLKLARHLDTQQPVFSVQPPGLDGSTPLTSVAALARYEIEQIRQVQPKGPYLIAGHCAGGTIAFEVAQQLTAAGHELALLALIGSPYPTMFRLSPQLMVYALRHARALVKGSWTDRSTYVAQKLQDRLTPPPSPPQVSAAAFAARKKVEAATVAAVRAYHPMPYTGHLDVFATAEAWHRPRRWMALAAKARQHPIPGFEIDELLLGPDVAVLAHALQNRLDTGFQ